MKGLIEGLENEKKIVQVSLNRAKSLFEVEKQMHNELRRSVDRKKKNPTTIKNSSKQVFDFLEHYDQ